MLNWSHLRVVSGFCFLFLAFSGFAPAQEPVRFESAGARLHRDFLSRLNQEIDAGIANFKNEPYQETTPLEPVEPNWVELGFIPFCRAYGISVYPNTVPGTKERGSLLAGFAAPGEDEPLAFGVRTLDSKVEKLFIRVGDLTCMDTTGFIPAENIDLGIVEYFRVRWGRGSIALEP